MHNRCTYRYTYRCTYRCTYRYRSELVEIVFTDGLGAVLGDWFFWLVLVLLLFFLFIWLSRLQQCLAKYDPLFIIPLVQVGCVARSSSR